MKIDRVVLGLTNNPTYRGFYNLFSPVWKKKYDIIPTLIFVGTEEEFVSHDISDEWGDIIRIDPVPNEVYVDPNLNWASTWAIFWGAAQFPDDIVMTCGIDQLPLSTFFFDSLDQWDDDEYIIGLGDAYTKYNQETLGYFNGMTDSFYPTSHHVAKGSLYKEVYSIHDSWEEEIKSVWEYSKDRYTLNNSSYWGLDECYASEKIDHYRRDNKDLFIAYSGFWEDWHPRRIDRGYNMKVNIEKLRGGQYSELHSPRPPSQYKEFLEEFVKIILDE